MPPLITNGKALWQSSRRDEVKSVGKMKMRQATEEAAEGRISQIDYTIPADKLTQEIIEQQAEKLHLPSTIKESQGENVPSGKCKEVELGKQSSNSAATKLAAAALRTVLSTKKKQQVEIAYLPGEWVIDINQRLKENNTYDGGKSWSIYRVPERLRQIQESAFAPKLVSIGPFHHKDINLQAGNEHKMRFLVRLLGGKFEKYDNDTDGKKLEEDQEEEECGEPMRHQGMIKLEELEKAMKLLENDARACYSEAFNDITSDEFVQMMVLDGCFIIEVLRLHYHSDKSKHHRRRIKDTNSKHRHVNVNDPIFHSHWMIQTLQSDFMMYMLLNFLAFEQCHYLTRPYFTNYIVFLDCLIDNECDVEVLHKAGVLNHAFGNNNDVANLINRVGREIVCDPNYNYLHKDMEDLNNFCNSYYASRVRTWWRNLIRNYFSTPWTAISLVAAGFLLILTLMQTFYAMYAYYLQPRSN